MYCITQLFTIVQMCPAALVLQLTPDDERLDLWKHVEWK